MFGRGVIFALVFLYVVFYKYRHVDVKLFISTVQKTMEKAGEKIQSQCVKIYAKKKPHKC